MSGGVVSIEDFKKLKREHPFRPFEIVTRQGAIVGVNDRLLFAANRKVVVVLDSQDCSTSIQLADITKIQPVT